MFVAIFDATQNLLAMWPVQFLYHHNPIQHKPMPYLLPYYFSTSLSFLDFPIPIFSPSYSPRVTQTIS